MYLYRIRDSVASKVVKPFMTGSFLNQSDNLLFVMFD